MNLLKLGTIFFLFLVVTIPIVTEERSPLPSEPSTTNNTTPPATVSESSSADSSKISLKLKNMDIIEVFNILSQKGKLNIIAGNDVRGRVTLFLDNVDIWEAFLNIIETNALAYERENDIIRVFTDREYEVIYGQRFYDKSITRVFPLKNVQAAVISPTIDSLKTRLGKVVIDENSNSLIVIDSPLSLDKIEFTLKQLDVPLKTTIYNLKYAIAQELSEKAKVLLSKRGTIHIDAKTNSMIVTDIPNTFILINQLVEQYDKKPYLHTEIFQLQYAKFDAIKEKIEKELTKDIGTIQADERTGNIVITDLPENIERLKPIIRALDQKHLEVLVDVKIFSIVLSDDYTFGINWEYVLSRYQHENLGFNIGSALLNLAENPVSDTPLRPFDSRSTKLDGNDISSNNPAGHVIFAGKMTGGKDGTGNPYQGILEMIRTLGDVNILSAPRVAVVSGQEAKIQIGTNEAYVTGTTTVNATNSTTAENVNFIEVGVNLKVTPRINQEKYITLDIEPEVSSVDRVLVTASGNRIPIVRTTNAKTQIMVEDGSTILMGGFIEKTVNKQRTKVPFFGSIPVISLLFKRIDDQWRNNEIILVITPKIIKGNEYAKEIDRLMPYFEQEKSQFPIIDDIAKLEPFKIKEKKN